MKKIDLKYYRVPKTVKIGGFKYEVIFPYIFKETSEYMGLHCTEDLKIFLTPYVSMEEIATRARVHEALLHEIIHGIDAVYFEDDMEHGDVYSLSNLFHQILHDNDLNLKDTSKPLPKKIKILGTVYDVLLHKFDELETNSSVSEDASLLRISNDITNLSYQRSLLVFCITASVFCKLRLFDPEIVKRAEEHRNKYRIFARAMYQVVVDNDLEKVMRNG